MFAYLCEYTKDHWILYFKWVSFMIFKLYLNKAVLNISGNEVLGIQVLPVKFFQLSYVFEGFHNRI